VDLTKFPVLFPVSREFDSGDGFDLDCVRRHLPRRLIGDSLFRIMKPGYRSDR